MSPRVFFVVSLLLATLRDSVPDNLRFPFAFSTTVYSPLPLLSSHFDIDLIPITDPLSMLTMIIRPGALLELLIFPAAYIPLHMSLKTY